MTAIRCFSVYSYCNFSDIDRGIRTLSTGKNQVFFYFYFFNLIFAIFCRRELCKISRFCHFLIGPNLINGKKIPEINDSFKLFKLESDPEHRLGRIVLKPIAVYVHKIAKSGNTGCLSKLFLLPAPSNIWEYASFWKVYLLPRQFIHKNCDFPITANSKGTCLLTNFVLLFHILSRKVNHHFSWVARSLEQCNEFVLFCEE